MLVVASVALRSLEEIEAMLYGLTLASYGQIQRGRAPRDFWRTKVRYLREEPRREIWQTWRTTVQRGIGDCEDLAAGLTACLWAAGESGARAVPIRIRPGLVHIVTRRASGAIEDPSKALGMVPP